MEIRKLVKGHHNGLFSALLVLIWAALGTNSQQYGGAPSGNGLDFWQSERPVDMASIVDLEVMCGKSHMEVKVSFDKPFNGIIFSKGAVDRYNCIYVKPQTGFSSYKFDIMYDQCGSKPDLNGRFYENNIVIQYDKDLIEVWDEAKRLRCEWYNDYEKGVTKPPIVVSDLEVVELNFRGDNVDCWMEIQQGKGPWASPVTGIVPLGTTLTMVVGIDDKEGEFDMRVKSCEASDNQNRPIQLSDGDGCVLRPKMVSKFMKMRSTDPRATVVTYAFFHAFKFPDSMAVHIKCKVEICRYGCPDHCQSPGSYVAREQEVSSDLNGQNNRRVDYAPHLYQLPVPSKLVAQELPRLAKENSEFSLHPAGEAKAAGGFFGLTLPQLPKLPELPAIFGGGQSQKAVQPKSDHHSQIDHADDRPRSVVPIQRTLNHEQQPLVFPSTINTARAHVKPIEPLFNDNYFGGSSVPYGPRALNVGAQASNLVVARRRRRSAQVLHRTERSADIGVQSGYEVVSEADLDFTPEEVARTVDTFQGKIKEDIIYGVCLPATGFSALFVLLALMTVVSVIVSGFICYHRQLAKVAEEAAPEPSALHAPSVAPSYMLKEMLSQPMFHHSPRQQ